MRRWNLALLLLAVHVLPGNAAGSKAAPREKVRMRRRGVLAWHNYQEETEDGTPLDQRVSRLHVHAQQDDTGLVYCKALRRALLWIRDQGLPVYPGCYLDLALTQYLDYLCYGSDKGLAEGRYAVSGCAAVFPASRLPETYRALKSWENWSLAKRACLSLWSSFFV